QSSIIGNEQSRERQFFDPPQWFELIGFEHQTAPIDRGQVATRVRKGKTKRIMQRFPLPHIPAFRSKGPAQFWEFRTRKSIQIKQDSYVSPLVLGRTPKESKRQFRGGIFDFPQKTAEDHTLTNLKAHSDATSFLCKR